MVVDVVISVAPPNGATGATIAVAPRGATTAVAPSGAAVVVVPNVCTFEIDKNGLKINLSYKLLVSCYATLYLALSICWSVGCLVGFRAHCFCPNASQ